MAFEHLKSTGGFRPLGGRNSSYGTGPVNPFTPGLNSSYSTKPPNPFTPGLNSSFNAGGLMRNNTGRGNGANGNAPKTGGELPPVSSAPPKSNPQWAFQPSPYDQPNYQMPMQNAAAYMTNPPAQPWMFDPSTYGAWGPPQWYGQPVVPNSQPPFRY